MLRFDPYLIDERLVIMDKWQFVMGMIDTNQKYFYINYTNEEEREEGKGK